MFFTGDGCIIVSSINNFNIDKMCWYKSLWRHNIIISFFFYFLFFVDGFTSFTFHWFVKSYYCFNRRCLFKKTICSPIVKNFYSLFLLCMSITTITRFILNLLVRYWLICTIILNFNHFWPLNGCLFRKIIV